MEFSADNLKYMAAEVVSNYLSHRVPLTEAIATVASTSKLNPEQVKRLVEISNQVAYLKLLEKATDRTFEFPLANYEDVMSILAMPDEYMKKEASQKFSPVEIASGKLEEETLEKTAQTEEDEEFGFLKRASKQERVALLNKQVHRVKGELEKIACEEQVTARDLITRAAELSEDDQFLSKVACIVDGDDKTLTKISRLVYGEKRDYCGEELFYESDLEDAREYVDLFKQAEELVDSRKNLEQQIHRALEVLEKEAFVQAVIPVATNVATKAVEVGKTLGGAARRGVKQLPEAVSKGFVLTDQILRKDKRDVIKSVRGKL